MGRPRKNPEAAYALCAARGVAPVAAMVHPALQGDDVLAAGFARLRGQLDAFIAAVRRRAAEDPALTGRGEAAGPALDLLAELFRRADARAGELARYADNARIAGLACERSYDALSP